MGLRTAHGRGAPALLRAETARADELPAGTPGSAREESPSDRGQAGRFAAGNGLASAGGKATAGTTRLSTRLHLATLPEGAPFRPYRAAATSFRKAQCAELARTVGGGHCGPGPSSIVASAALALAWSRFLSDRAASSGDAELAIKAIRLAESSRQALLTAHELCAREAVARAAQRGPVDPLAPWHGALPATTTSGGGDATSAEDPAESPADGAASSTIECSEAK